MQYIFDDTENQRLLEARESFSGRMMTNGQFGDAVAIVAIVKREILKSGTFTEKLGDYAYAFARTERFDVAKSETVIRDLFRTITGMMMNQMREGLLERESKLTPAQTRCAHDFALATGKMIEEGNKITFSRAYAYQGQALANELGVTEACAKRLMKEEFAAAENLDFYEYGKDLEERFYRPQIEAERQQSEGRHQEDGSARMRDNSRSRSRGPADGRNERTASRSTQSRMRYAR